MDQSHLRELLEQLHGELSQGSALDEPSRQLLLDVQADIARVLPLPGAEPTPLPAGEHQRVQGRVQSAVVGFERSHPRLASTLEQVANALSNMGL